MVKTKIDKDLILRALSEYSCSTSKELSNYIKRTYNEAFAPSTITRVLNEFEKEGKVAKSNCGIGTHYWVVD